MESEQTVVNEFKNTLTIYSVPLQKEALAILAGMLPLLEREYEADEVVDEKLLKEKLMETFPCHPKGNKYGRFLGCVVIELRGKLYLHKPEFQRQIIETLTEQLPQIEEEHREGQSGEMFIDEPLNIIARLIDKPYEKTEASQLAYSLKGVVDFFQIKISTWNRWVKNKIAPKPTIIVNGVKKWSVGTIVRWMEEME